MPAIETLEPFFSCFQFDLAETVGKRRCSSLQFSKNAFKSVPVSVVKHLKSDS